jgi:hypothetical protein
MRGCVQASQVQTGLPAPGATKELDAATIDRARQLAGLKGSLCGNDHGFSVYNTRRLLDRLGGVGWGGGQAPQARRERQPGSSLSSQPARGARSALTRWGRVRRGFCRDGCRWLVVKDQRVITLDSVVDDLVAAVPEAAETVLGHLDDQEGELLIHLLMADLLRLTVRALEMVERT